MAYMSQEKKAIIKAALDKVLKPRGIKYSLRVRDNMAIHCTITAAPIDFIGNFAAKSGDKYQLREGARLDHLQVNLYWINDHFTGEAAEVLTQAAEALKAAGYYDNSNSQIDYFDTAYYMHLDIGRYDKPFQFIDNRSGMEKFVQWTIDTGRLEFIKVGA
jgi:hypothetical protein